MTGALRVADQRQRNELLAYLRQWLAERLEVWRKLDLACHGDARNVLAELLALDRILNDDREATG
jgi:hypothetical protein